MEKTRSCWLPPKLNRFWFLIAVLFILSGCADHYYRIKEDSVHIYLKKPDTEKVYFASSLDGYQRHRATRIDGQTWEVLVPIDREFRYFYLIEDALYLPPCRFKEQDDFGSENCIYVPGM